MTEIHLVRHAHAGTRGTVDDASRPLSDKGRAQASVLASTLATLGITRVLTSEFLRCIQTVEPVAAALGIPAESDVGLNEGAGPDRTLALIEQATEPLVICSHGDVLGSALHGIAQLGVPLDDDRLEKAGRWIIAVDAGCIRQASYRSPRA